MEARIRKLLERFEKVEELLGSSEVLADREQYRALTQEHFYLSQVKEKWERCAKLQKQLEENRALVREEKDPEFLAVIREDIAQLEAAYQSEHLQLETLLVPPDPMVGDPVLRKIVGSNPLRSVSGAHLSRAARQPQYHCGTSSRDRRR